MSLSQDLNMCGITIKKNYHFQYLLILKLMLKFYSYLCNCAYTVLSFMANNWVKRGLDMLLECIFLNFLNLKT